MALIWAWLRVELPRRWRSLTVLALLVAIASATVLASVAGPSGEQASSTGCSRRPWRVVAENTPLQYVPPVAIWALVLIVRLALLITNLFAAVPGRRAARLRVGETLRAE